MKLFVKYTKRKESGRITAVAVLEILLLIVMICAAVRAYINARTQIFNVNSVEIVGNSLPDQESFEFSVESVAKEKVGQGESDYLTMKGWIVKRGINADKSHATVVLRNQGTGEFFSVPTVMQDRLDVTQCFYDGYDYDNCATRS